MTVFFAVEVAVIVTTPPFTPRTVPSESTVAILRLELLQVTAELVLDGKDVTESCAEAPFVTLRVPVMVRLVGAGRFCTVTFSVILTLELTRDVAVIVAVPARLAVSRPFALTVTTLVRLLFHLTSLLLSSG